MNEQMISQSSSRPNTFVAHKMAAATACFDDDDDEYSLATPIPMEVSCFDTGIALAKELNFLEHFEPSAPSHDDDNEIQLQLVEEFLAEQQQLQ